MTIIAPLRPTFSHEDAIAEDTSETQQSPPSSPAPAAASSSQIDPIKEAEKEKEQGNVAFKAGRFQDAIEKYSRATGAPPIYV